MQMKALVLAIAAHFLVAALAAAKASSVPDTPPQAAASNDTHSSVADLRKTFAAGQAALQRGDLAAA